MGHFLTWQRRATAPSPDDAKVHTLKSLVDLVTYVLSSRRSMDQGDELGAVYRLERARSLITGYSEADTWWDTHPNRKERITAFSQNCDALKSMIPFLNGQPLELAWQAVHGQALQICDDQSSTDATAGALRQLLVDVAAE
ncbi:hypothetical protein A5687_21300 [Mycobacterium mantenii]|nr:hypothetical protein A5687_21300 [Mycobacterium mantenii]